MRYRVRTLTPVYSRITGVRDAKNIANVCETDDLANRNRCQSHDVLQCVRARAPPHAMHDTSRLPDRPQGGAERAGTRRADTVSGAHRGAWMVGVFPSDPETRRDQKKRRKNGVANRHLRRIKHVAPHQCVRAMHTVEVRRRLKIRNGSSRVEWVRRALPARPENDRRG